MALRNGGGTPPHETCQQQPCPIQGPRPCVGDWGVQEITVEVRDAPQTVTRSSCGRARHGDAREWRSAKPACARAGPHAHRVDGLPGHSCDHRRRDRGRLLDGPESDRRRRTAGSVGRRARSGIARTGARARRVPSCVHSDAGRHSVRPCDVFVCLDQVAGCSPGNSVCFAWPRFEAGAWSCHVAAYSQISSTVAGIVIRTEFSGASPVSTIHETVDHVKVTIGYADDVTVSDGTPTRPTFGCDPFK